MSKQSSSDPLPYVQIDRAAEPTFALLAGNLKVSHQHAIGALYEFWKLCGDPRELEAVVAATPVDKEPELILTADDVALRFELASGCRVEPVVLARLHILEQRPEGFRVRGMSRSFEPIVKRLRAREVAALGGKASAESRKSKTGSAQPSGGKGSEVGSDAGSDEGVAEPNRQPKRNRTDNRTGTEPTTEAEPSPSGQRSAVRDVKDARLKPLTERLVATFLELRGVKYLYAGLEDTAGLKRLLPVATDDEIDRRWRLALKAGSDWPGTSSLAQLAGSKRWNDLATAKATAVSIEHQPSRMF